MVTPGPREEAKWVTARKGKARVTESTPVDVPLHNKYSCLSTAEGDSPPGGSSSGRVSRVEAGPVTQRAKEKRGTAVLIGDSTVRGTDRRFCGGRRESHRT